jgi:hypothetical protein
MRIAHFLCLLQWPAIHTFRQSGTFDVSCKFRQFLTAGALFWSSVLPLAAQAVPDTSISGTVTDSSGNALQDIQVEACLWNGSDCTGSYSDDTNASGNYTIDGLGTGTYRIKFYDDNGTYVEEYYNDAANLTTAADISVTSGSTVSNINAQLANAGLISGTVTDSSGNALQNIRVEACLVIIFGCIDILYFDDTDASGNYTIRGLGTGTYQVKFYDNHSTYATEYYNDAASSSISDDISVTAGSTVSNIDAVMAKAGLISGTVTDSSANGLGDIRVEACLWNEDHCTHSYSGKTDSSGTYTIGDLIAGLYRVRFYHNNGTYATEYYTDASTLDSATDINVTAGGAVSNINAVMANAGFISGTVTDSSGNGLENIFVEACLSNDCTSSHFSSTDASGSYTIGGLGTGAYRVSFNDFSGTYITEYYDNASTLDSATNISVTAGSTVSNINAELANAGSISGTVTDSSSNTLIHVLVVACLWNGNSCSREYYGHTTEFGDYTIGGLATGTYPSPYTQIRLSPTQKPSERHKCSPVPGNNPATGF